MAASIQSAIAKLKHKDVRQRRRAVRVLFDSDAHESVEAFSPFLDDDDVWFRNKAIEAYRRWAPKHAPHLLEDLAKKGQLDGQRCVAMVFDSIADTSYSAVLARLLLDSSDPVVVRRAVKQLLSTELATSTELQRFKSSDDHVIRSAAASVNPQISDLLECLKDPHPDVRRQAASSLLIMDLDHDANKALQDALENDEALWKLAVPIALEYSRPYLVDLVEAKRNTQRRFLVQALKEAVHEADDPRLQTLLDAGCTSVVARWLVGRNDSKSDSLRNDLLFDERVDSIDKSRLLERLLHRNEESEIRELAEKLLNESTDEVVLSAAQNLYTA